MKANELRIGNYVHIESFVDFSKSSKTTTLIEILTPNDINSFNMFTPIPLTEEWLMDKFVGFEKTGSSILISYSIDISWNKNEFRKITVTVESGNQYVYLRSGDLNKPRENDDVITIFNGDYHGKLYVHTLQNIYQIHAYKELIIKQ